MKALARFWLAALCIVASAVVWASLSEQIHQVNDRLKPLGKIEVGVDQVALALEEVKAEGPKQENVIETTMRKQEEVLETSLNNIRLYMIDRDAQQDAQTKPVTIEVHDQPFTQPRPGLVQHHGRPRVHAARATTPHTTPWDNFPCDEACVRNAIR